jgi:hypothetical protein
MARSTLSKFSPLTRSRSLTLPTPRAHYHLQSTPSIASPPELAVSSIASPSMLLNRFALDVDRFARSTPLPLALEHAIDLDRFTQSTLPPLAPEHAVDLNRFTDAPDHVLHRCPRPLASLDCILPLPIGNP